MAYKLISDNLHYSWPRAVITYRKHYRRGYGWYEKLFPMSKFPWKLSYPGTDLSDTFHRTFMLACLFSRTERNNLFIEKPHLPRPRLG